MLKKLKREDKKPTRDEDEEDSEDKTMLVIVLMTALIIKRLMMNKGLALMRVTVVRPCGKKRRAVWMKCHARETALHNADTIKMGTAFLTMILYHMFVCYFS